MWHLRQQLLLEKVRGDAVADATQGQRANARQPLIAVQPVDVQEALLRQPFNFSSVFVKIKKGLILPPADVKLHLVAHFARSPDIQLC